MEKLYEYAKNVCVNFKLDSCCCIAPIRIGLLYFGYLNMFISFLSLVGTADVGYTPPLMAVQAVILDDDFSKPLGIVAYGTELAFNMLLLCGLYRSDIILLRVYIYYVIASIISSVLVYSIVFILISLLTKFVIIGILVFQCYLIVLVRSVIVEIRESRTSEKNGHVTLYSVVRMPDDISTKGDEYPIPTKGDEYPIPTKGDELPVPEVTVDPQNTSEPKISNKEDHQESDEVVQSEQNKDEPQPKLETIKEHLKEN